MVKEKFNEIGVTMKTNHSLHVTGATSLYSANVPETIIQQQTGHQSLKALRSYECTSDDLAVSKILTSQQNDQYEQAMAKESSLILTFSPPSPQTNILKQVQISKDSQNFVTLLNARPEDGMS